MTRKKEFIHYIHQHNFMEHLEFSQTLCWMPRILRVIKAEMIPAFMKFTVHMGEREGLGS